MIFKELTNDCESIDNDDAGNDADCTYLADDGVAVWWNRVGNPSVASLFPVPGVHPAYGLVGMVYRPCVSPSVADIPTGSDRGTPYRGRVREPLCI